MSIIEASSSVFEFNNSIPAVFETQEKGILTKTSRIYFEAMKSHSMSDSQGNTPHLARRSISEQTGRQKIGIKKAGFFERLFGKATKLSFDGGKTHTYVNTKSLHCYIFDLSQHTHFFNGFSLGKITPKGFEGEGIFQPVDPKEVKKAHQVSFEAFKARALGLNRGADTISGSPRLPTAVRLGQAIGEYAKAIDLFNQCHPEPEEKTKELNRIQGVPRVSSYRSNNVMESSQAVYTQKHNWARLHEYLYSYPYIAANRKLQAGDQLRSRVVQIDAVERQPESTNSDLLTKTAEVGAAALIGLGATAVAGPIGLFGASALYGMYKAGQYLVGPQEA